MARDVSLSDSKCWNRICTFLQFAWPVFVSVKSADHFWPTANLEDKKTMYTQGIFFRNLVDIIQIWIVITYFRSISHQTYLCLALIPENTSQK